MILYYFINTMNSKQPFENDKNIIKTIVTVFYVKYLNERAINRKRLRIRLKGRLKTVSLGFKTIYT